MLALALAWVALAAWRGGYFRDDLPASSSAPLVSPHVERVVSARSLEVVDGDTFLLEGRELRLLGADTPEKGAPWFRGDQEPWASRAADFARDRLARAREVRLCTRGRRDPYERELAHLLVDGEPLAALLVEAGLAYPTVERFGEGGFPHLAAQVVARARPPVFEEPWRWRKRHRR